MERLGLVKDNRDTRSNNQTESEKGYKLDNGEVGFRIQFNIKDNWLVVDTEIPIPNSSEDLVIYNAMFINQQMPQVSIIPLKMKAKD
jgi:hypothetical protein